LLNKNSKKLFLVKLLLPILILILIP
jgi:hypothetical protein